VAFDNPQPPAIVEGERNRLGDVGLAGKQRRPKAFRHREMLGRFGSGTGGRLVFAGGKQRANEQDEE
jgi:hypothetical protein